MPKKKLPQTVEKCYGQLIKSPRFTTAYPWKI